MRSVAKSHNQIPDLEAQSDEELARQSGRTPQAFAELYHRHLQAIYRFHLARTGNAPDAQDLTSQTFLAALESLQNYRGRGSFRGWLFGIARHKLMDHYRRRRPEEPLDGADAFAGHEPQPEELAAIQLDMAQVAEVLRTLPEPQVEALTLRIFGGLSAAETGEIMGKSETAVRMLVYRGLNSLRDRIASRPEVSR